MQLKPGNSIEKIRRWNDELVLLIDYYNGESINRAYYAGERFNADALLSIYSEDDLREGELAWTLLRGTEIVRTGSRPAV